MIYFDNAATTFPKPKRVRDAVAVAMELYGANPGRSGHKLSMDTAVKVYECREAVAGFFGAQTVEDVVFTLNCTHALNLALKGALKQGDHVIISDIEHNSVLRPVHALSERGVITYSVAEVDETDDDRTVENFKRLILPNTKLIACAHGSNVWGIRSPVEKISRLAAEHDVLFLVDAAQTAGVVPISMETTEIDFLCTAGHKSLYGPSGTGLLITPLGTALTPCFEGGTGTMSADFGQPDGMPERLESGTVNTAGIIGLEAGVAYVREKGVENIFKTSMHVAGEIYEGLSVIKGVRLYTKGFAYDKNLPVVSFNIDGLNSEEVTERLSRTGFATRGGLHCSPLAHKKMGTMESGAVRVSVGSFNTPQQARQLLWAIRNIAK